MENKNEIFDDIEILDEELEETPTSSDDLIANDWLSDFTNIEKNIPIQNEDIVEMMNEAPTKADDAIPIIQEEPKKEIKIENERENEILNSVEAATLDNGHSFQPSSIEENPQTNDVDIEEELNNNRSVVFIATLFGILLIFVLLLPTITKILGE